MIHLSWEDIEELVARLVVDLPRDYDLLLVVTRGGMVPACLISEQTDIRNIVAAAVMFYSTNVGDPLPDPVFLQFPADPLLYGKRILVVDDVWDTGRTIVAVKQRIEAAGGQADLAVLHYKPANSKIDAQPDYYAETTDAWIVYPWDPSRAEPPKGISAWKLALPADAGAST